MSLKLKTLSIERYNGGVKAKRKYGSNCITKFAVYRPEDERNYSMHVEVETGWRTPGERATAAKVLAEPLILALIAKHSTE